MKKQKNKKTQGFTLIELLVVISIIGLLTSITLVAINSARIKARNARRNDDVQQLAKAFNLGLNNPGATFPDSSGAYLNSGWVCISTTCSGGWAPYYNTSTVDTYLTKYAQKPTDPSDGGARGYGGYLYNSNWGGGTALDGTFFPTGTYIIYLSEAPPSVVSTSNACGAARVWWAAPGYYVECAVPLN